MKVLVPTDFSAPSRAATEFAVEFSRLTNSEVVLHHAYYTLVDWVKAPAASGEDYPELKSKIEQVRSELEKLEREFEDVNLETELSFHETIDEMMNSVRESGYDLIVAGTHGKDDLGNRIMGSDAQRMIRLADCPVLILNKGIRRFPFRHILFVSDLSKDDSPRLGRLFRLADPLEAEVHLGYINTPMAFQNTEETQEGLRRLQAAFPDRDLPAHIYNQVRVDQGVVKLAQQIDADIIALVTHGRSGWSRLFYQSLTEKLALECQFPVIGLHGYGERGNG